MERVGLEACSLTAWLHEGLRRPVCRRSASRPGRPRRRWGPCRTRPTATMPARSRRSCGRAGSGGACEEPPCRLWRALLVARRTVLNKMRRSENVVRAMLREDGLKVGTPSRKDFANKVREMASGDTEAAVLTEPLLAVLGTMIEQLQTLTRRVLDNVRGRADLPASDERAGCRPDHRAGVPCHDRPAGPLPEVARCRRPSRADAAALPVRRNRHPGPDQPMRRRTGPHGTLRGGPFVC